MKVTFFSLLGTDYDISVFPSDEISTIKEEVETFFGCSNIRFFKNYKEIIGGSIESNNIIDGDKINFTINMKTGNDIAQQKIDLVALQTINNYTQTLMTEMNKINDISNDTKKFSDAFLTPIEQLQHLQQTDSLKEEDYDREDMRILFQNCLIKI